MSPMNFTSSLSHSTVTHLFSVYCHMVDHTCAKSHWVLFNELPSFLPSFAMVSDFCFQFIQMLQQKFDHHPELLEAKIAHEKLQLELQDYKKFFDLGERSALKEEITHLQSQLDLYLDSKISGSLIQCQRVPTPQKPDVDHSQVKVLSGNAVPEAPSSGEPSSPDQLKNELLESTMEGSAGHLLEQERREWEKREKQWILVVQGLREECDHHSNLVERIRKELEGEKR